MKKEKTKGITYQNLTKYIKKENPKHLYKAEEILNIKEN